ncbi:hypothetical protein J3E72DRAFT_376639 [Bipolaris maydis]|uniref:uncharacterized protein n=1 Tax=Cochliobolus heterostrophus TaxID=5016 RepID=UPI0024D5A321|nr:hypothetical protein BM1_06875 [Bipolaris maydis]KAJ5023880.1 hypothetical protein J3E73DRAFT_373076 [Bipolaris maydis]KAJ5058169.1 hypothetical protein J3E74DRAFT_408421 [Bipolaris maydis]KAJ6195418.1 hypothetical protein J3E72DRAFT_376639 [Bipolaris maydis]KAJ6268913.1 hypothetical protein PSV08DRAFT_353312 [Bipolaris maydis]
MPSRPIFLIIYAAPPGRRSHFSIWVPTTENARGGTIIHVVGAPMLGFSLEFKRDYKPDTTWRTIEMIPIGNVMDQHLHLSESNSEASDMPCNDIERAATQVQPPRANPNFLTTTSSDCQTWMLEYVRHLVAIGYLDEAAINIVQSKQDPPQVGVGLRSIADAQQSQQ